MLKCAPNFRDMGGLPTHDGRVVRPGMLYRSEAVLNPVDEDAARLRELGIRLVCDLRGHNERVAAPNDWWRENGIEMLEMDITADIRTSPEIWHNLRNDAGAAGARALMLTTYRVMPAAAGKHLNTIFSRLADGSVPILIHCTAGKDRTGFVGAMVLLALGVKLPEVYADYLASNDRPNPAVVAATRKLMNLLLGAEISEQALNAIIGVEAGYLEESLAVIQSGHGSVEDYLGVAVALDSDKRQRLRDLLLQ